MQSLWMLVASFLFSIMGVCVKLASDYYSTAEIVAFRGLIGMAMILALVKLQGGTLRTSMPSHHLWRGMIGVVSLWMWFFAITKLPLATAVTLNYMSPIWIAVILFATAWWQGKKRADMGLIAAVALGFAGVVLLLRPSMQADQMLGGIIGLASGMLAALAYLQVRQMGLMGEPEYRVVFYFSATCFMAGMLGAVLTGGVSAAQNMSDWHHHGIKSFLLLLVIGFTAASAQIAMTRAYRLGNTLVTANLQYVGIVFSSAWDVLLWHDVLKWQSWLGIAVILASGLTATFYNAKNNKPVVASDPIGSE
ncbi:DMT family transporter [Undibacterium sp.]|jgi:S-adenosylmethionine uptake transporter|uniref:DMT family transporter n=1 Tax=Undibacterium sp. TaxID=1914977 RepID=UPI002CDCC63D|nr:DMT family transporter [Undibacterium sp.]HTD04648.1 DMT family transporter [Undibacterium sp.]